MRRSESFVLLKNAVANVARGSSAAIVAVALPPFLTRLMSTESYGAWSLVLQLSAYVGYLDFGLQTAVGRFMAYATEKRDERHRDRIVSTSLAALVIAGVCGLLAIAGGAAALPHVFRQMPLGLVRQTRLAFVLVGSSLAVGLPASVFNGVFVGLQRYEVPAVIVGGSRIITAILLVLMVKDGGNLVTLAAVTAAVNIAAYCFQYLMYRKLAPVIRLSPSLVSRETGRELFNYCTSLTVWSFATLLVTGLDLFLVGIFDFHAVAYYTVAATLIAFILGLQNAIFGVLIPRAAVLGARQQPTELGKLLISSTRLGMLFLLASGMPLLVATRPILSFWLGHLYAEKTFVILRVLVAANIVRLSALPYAMLLIGTGQQRLVTVTPLVEGTSNLIVSVVAGALFGAIGVAIGTAVGSVIGILCNFFYNLPRTQVISVDTIEYLKDGLLRPSACLVPWVTVIIFEWLLPNSAGVLRNQLLALTTFCTLITIWLFGLTEVQRSRLLTRLRLVGQ